jgi:hypothetical protein
LTSAWLLIGCGDDTVEGEPDAGGDTAVGDSEADQVEEGRVVTITGYATAHELTELITGSLATIDDATLTVGIVNPTALLGGADLDNPISLISANLDTSDCTADGCLFELTGVDTTDVGLGLLAYVDDAGDAYIPSFTGIASPAMLAEWSFGDVIQLFVEEGGTITRTPPVSAVSPDLEAALSGIVGTAAEGAAWDPGELACRGFVLGTLLDRNDTPAAGAVVDLGSISASVYYLDSDAGAAGDETNASGSFVIVADLPEGNDGPCEAGDLIATIGGLSATSEDFTWSTTVGFAAGGVLVLYLPPEE